MEKTNNMFFKKIPKKMYINDYNFKKIKKLAKKKDISDSYALNIILDKYKI